ncbi:StbB family protein [Pusillimonas sp. NJUB218]|uniref:StbB family protein n=1 Tax=Pusillimonas sp. NJUB218 TaxID=2023230 RepID=UPI000F4C7618|nr:StbB family protein [Pusillimonas sp. NJUB218]ROT46753.1 plasmid stability protein StbB [Pusillimonas sp. NJUB218]
MKVAVLNYSGSVGKTIVASHLLAPRMNHAPIFAVETTNETAADLGLDIDQLRGEQFGKLFRDLLRLHDAIVDVGASNIEDFLSAMTRYEGAYEEIDFFVLPVIGTGKAQRETIKTITALVNLGVAPERIRVLFNRVQSDVEEEFLPVLTYASKTGDFVANAQALVYENEVFELLADARTSIADVLADQTDYRNLLRQADHADTARITHLTNRHALRALAKPVDRQLNTAFAALFEE